MPGVPVKGSVEGFGLAYLEAAAQGVPSIATRLGGAAEAVAHERSGLVVAPGDGEALSRALSSLLDDPELHARMKAGALAHAQEHSWRRVAELTYAQ
jgi:glycosyltransferase involved in cell wall biosynthesis